MRTHWNGGSSIAGMASRPPTVRRLHQTAVLCNARFGGLLQLTSLCGKTICTNRQFVAKNRFGKMGALQESAVCCKQPCASGSQPYTERHFAANGTHGKATDLQESVVCRKRPCASDATPCSKRHFAANDHGRATHRPTQTGTLQQTAVTSTRARPPPALAAHTKRPPPACGMRAAAKR